MFSVADAVAMVTATVTTALAQFFFVVTADIAIITLVLLLSVLILFHLPFYSHCYYHPYYYSSYEPSLSSTVTDTLELHNQVHSQCLQLIFSHLIWNSDSEVGIAITSIFKVKEKERIQTSNVSKEQRAGIAES